MLNLRLGSEKSLPNCLRYGTALERVTDLHITAEPVLPIWFFCSQGAVERHMIAVCSVLYICSQHLNDSKKSDTFVAVVI